MRSPIPIFSVAEYLEAETKSELRHEYLGGQIFVMAGGSKALTMADIAVLEWKQYTLTSLQASLLKGERLGILLPNASREGVGG